MGSGVYKRTKDPWNKGLTKDTDSRVAEYGRKGSIANKGRISPMKGRCHTQETKDLIRMKSKAQIPRLHTQEAKDKMRKARLGVLLTQETKDKIGIKATIRFQNPEYRTKMSNALAGLPRKPRPLSACLKMSDTLKRMYREDPEFVKRLRRRQAPTSPERLIIELDVSNDLGISYVGNGALNIDGKNPDFVSIEDKYKLIEIFGCYWHCCKKHFKSIECRDSIIEKQYRKDLRRINELKKLGYSVLIVWECELKYIEKVVAKIRKFVEAKQ